MASSLSLEVDELENQFRNVQFNTIPKAALFDNVHNDDIHCLLRVDNQKFLSGSKDMHVKLWNYEESTKKLEKNFEYKSDSWVTSLSSSLSNAEDGCICGYRSGKLMKLNIKSDEKTPLNLDDFNSEEVICKSKNINRINCLHTSKSREGVLYIGKPTKFFIYDLKKDIINNVEYVDQNDWVYCIHELDENKLLIVVGGRLELWERKENQFNKTVLYNEPARRTKQRNFISAIKPLINKEEHFSLSTFGGDVKVFDISSSKIVFSANEHKGRVWMCENISPSVLASCADDGCMKFWDIREKKSIQSVINNPDVKSRVSVLLKLNEATLISASCPDNVNQSKNKARLMFWELRNF